MVESKRRTAGRRRYTNASGQVIYVDKNMDSIPDELEAALGYDKTKYSTFPP